MCSFQKLLLKGYNKNIGLMSIQLSFGQDG